MLPESPILKVFNNINVTQYFISMYLLMFKVILNGKNNNNYLSRIIL
ncbi:hypothetical protein PROVRETT_08386 [Providencia rettgeri DSM 1131]|nr:hypothetical protein PROVRETT_08386 [Providencia rettgeri DSM 1131]